MNLLEVLHQYPWYEPSPASEIEVGIYGVPPAAWAPLAGSILQQRKQVSLLIAPNTEHAERVQHDLEVLFGSEENPPEVLLWPLPDVLGSSAETDSRTTQERLAILDALRRPAPHGLVVVASANALAHSTLPPQELQQGCGELKVGDEIDRDAFIENLVESGYERVEEVNSPGQIAVRGGIIDFYPPASGTALRLELFDVEIDSLRIFDPATQRSYQDVSQFRLTPPREEHLTPARGQEIAAQVRDLLKLQMAELVKAGSVLEAQNLEKNVEADIALLETGSYFPALRRYRSLLYPEKATVLEHLPANSTVIWANPDRAALQNQRLHDEQMQAREAQFKNGVALRLPSALCTFEQLCQRASAFHQIDLRLQPPPGSEKSTFEMHTPPVLGGQLNNLVDWVRQWQVKGGVLILSTAHARRVKEILADGDVHQVELLGDVNRLEPGSILILGERMSSGFVAEFRDKKYPPLALLTDVELFGWQNIQQKIAHKHRGKKPKTKFSKSSKALGGLGDLQIGDYVVHIQHGIARYGGVVRQEVDGSQNDYLLLEYSGSDRLYISVDQLYRVQKYLGAGGAEPSLNSLHNDAWERTRKRVKEDTIRIAKQLAELYGAREQATKEPVTPDTPWQRELETAFPYEETASQLQAIKDTKRDMESPRPMDRLVCGDVGFGKTEVAVRAAFKAVQAGLQVAVLVPTTVLAQQHYQTFAERMAPYPLRVEAVSRFRSAAEQRHILAEVSSGAVDIIIGTHRLLQSDVKFHNLGLVIVDEEQRFGVLQKEKLKELRAEVDLLTLSATPIPRTMHQAMGGLREISLITDPPSGRLPVRTYVMPYREEDVRDAIERELEREGQIYYVHNRIGSIYHVAQQLQELVPQLRISIGHGQMADGDLEQVMLDFMHHRTDILLATTIIENGLDLPNVNTLIVDRAERLGLSQMYQLRGRVGRSSRQAYAYFLRGTQAKIKAAAEERFSALQENTDLGSGFKIAMRDLEIRGAGDLLGTKQSGNIEAVGFELYTQMLAEAVENLKSGQRRSRRKQEQLPTVDIPLSAYLPEDYIPSEADRLEMYQKLSNLTNAEDISGIRGELRDRFGLLPLPVNQLLRVCAIRLHLQRAVLRGITHHNGEVIIRLKTGDQFTDADMAAVYVKLNKAADQRTLVNITSRPNEGLVFNANALNESTLLRLLETACAALAEVRGERLLGV